MPWENSDFKTTTTKMFVVKRWVIDSSQNWVKGTENSYVATTPSHGSLSALEHLLVLLRSSAIWSPELDLTETFQGAQV